MQVNRRHCLGREMRHAAACGRPAGHPVRRVLHFPQPWMLPPIGGVVGVILRLFYVGGGYIGQRVMNDRLSPTHIKQGIAMLLLLLTAIMIWAHIQMRTM